MVSPPDYQVQAAFDVMVEMRDGTALATDIYRPADPETGRPIEEPKPALLERTPYNKRESMERHGHWFAKRGFVVAIQDCRGRFESEGEFSLLVNEPEDGHDTVEWLAGRSYCDGQVGTIGTSYGAWVQNALATEDPSGLAAMFVNQGGANGWEATLRHNGAFELRWLCWALAHGGGFAKRALENPPIQQLLANVDTGAVLANGPIRRGQSPLRHLPGYEDWVFDLMTSEGTEDLWDSPGIKFEEHYAKTADVPTVYAGGWYDSYAKATCDNFVGLSEQKESDHYLLMGPWTHGWDSYPQPSWNKPYSGELEFGGDSTLDYQTTRLRFFDHYLKGRETWDDQPTVQYWCMGTGDGHRVDDHRLFHGGEWRAADDWPLADTRPTRYYAHANGSLSTEKPTAEHSSTSYDFDPSDPVPTIGGNCSSYLTVKQSEKSLLEYPFGVRGFESIVGPGGYDQRTRPETFGATEPYGPLEERDDVLVFRTPPLEEPVEVVGPISVRVYASTDVVDTDFTAKLVEEHPPTEDFPNGFAVNLADSICRARYRGYRTEPDPIEPGEVYEFYMEPYPTANRFKEGSSIRLDVSSSNFPRYDVNTNTGEPHESHRGQRVATNTVHHSRAHPTHVELPIKPIG